MTVSVIDDDPFGINTPTMKAVKQTPKFTSGVGPKNVDRMDFLTVVGAAYQYWTYAKDFAGLAELKRDTDVAEATIKKILASEEYYAALRSRGVPIRNTEGLTAEQMYCIQVLTNPTDRRDVKKKLAACGVTYLQYRGWMQQPAFANYMHKITEGMLTDHLPDMLTVLTNKAMNGDLNAIKYVNELSGRHDPNKQQVVELQAVVRNLLEIIMRNVTDEETLRRISNEFALVMNAAQGKTVKGEIAR